MIINIKFPCGYEFNYKTSLFDNTGIAKFPNECPLHGKKCRKEKKAKVRKGDEV